MSVQDFQVLYKLGEGTYSKVFKVIRLSDQTDYALKRVELQQLSENEVNNALNEVRLLASVDHENVISYKEAFYDEKQKCLCIVMEFASAGDLKRRVNAFAQARSHFEEHEIWDFIGQIASGLKSLHDRNIVHCDMKSANIFLTADGKYKLGDMNVSKVAKNGKIDVQTGTPYYASPEVWRDEPYDFRSDIWSLGVIVYEMATSQLPFKGRSDDELYENVQKAEYEPLPSSFSQDFAAFVSHCLSRDPASRPTCGQILSNPRLTKQACKESSGKCQLLDTIRVDNFYHLRNSALPKPKYQLSKSKEKQQCRAEDSFYPRKSVCKQHSTKPRKETVRANSPGLPTQQVQVPRSGYVGRSKEMAVPKDYLQEKRQYARSRHSLAMDEANQVHTSQIGMNQGKQISAVKGVNAYMRQSPSPPSHLPRYEMRSKERGREEIMQEYRGLSPKAYFDQRGASPDLPRDYRGHSPGADYRAHSPCNDYRGMSPGGLYRGGQVKQPVFNTTKNIMLTREMERDRRLRQQRGSMAGMRSWSPGYERGRDQSPYRQVQKMDQQFTKYRLKKMM